jgi:protein-tyrosine phosphatase
MRVMSNSQRIIPIPAGHNLRDLGGYEAAEGRRIKWRRLYRSGIMSNTTDADREKFAELGIVAICDLRGNKERARDPTTWHEPLRIDYWARDYDLSIGSLHELAKRAALTRESVLQVITETYVHLPYEQAPSYRALFLKLAEGRVPLLFNCTAGKDRTGIAAALVLHALGVPREVIFEDYALTDLVIDRLVEMMITDPKYDFLAAFPREHYLPLMQAKASYLETAFDEMTAKHGSVDGYLREVLEIGAPEIDAIRGFLLET